ncbi:glycine--tRNA ligase subunit alpha/beta [Mangrovactinospora gilvigrisea]|uniref:Multifunctional fusion protein n=2 Tax=Mangrovactinospora gilvigrisea TaxID=1428644 RepID=A0A1J7CGA3_9ACTN|nr:glycine--tRNA ligase subunit alpha/beta [Mangrovactinospora gilvigrisea]
MQETLHALTEYWTGRGCMTVQPMNTEVGAGTLNPATFLRVQGPEPWRTAYVEPSVRPDDSRYGQNPNRLQTHTQFQVILKPDPGNPQELYLESLKRIGIDIAAHDIRFVEDNWANPATGSWGLGWEVWLDGLEITQFTYFQQAGGITLDPVSVEITYGIERILMALQGVSNFKEIRYAPGITYGEVFGQAEYEMSRYYLDEADVAANRELFDTYAAEARRLLDARLPVPAYTYVLKCSHTFNVLDARGAISTTERAKAFSTMRNLSQQVAALWGARREEEGHPLGRVQPPASPELPADAVAAVPHLAEPAPLAFEVGVEEMPPHEVTQAAEAVRAALAEKLGGTRLAHGAIRVVASPRRIVALVDEIAPREEDHQQTTRGPKLAQAFDAEGRPTKAAEGFARGQGLEIGQLTRIAVGDTEHLAAVKHIAGRSAAEVLAAVLPEIVRELRSDKNMRWNAPGLSFTRPIRWILALLGEHVVPFTVSSLASGRTTRVHRNAEQPELQVAHAEGYVKLLASHGILADADARRRLVVSGADALAVWADGHVDTAAESALLDEITNLVEQPTPILGRFEEKYLDLPSQILTTVMRKHQRYLPVLDASDRLLPNFVAVANGRCDEDRVRAGNEAVLRARYEDAAFFWNADLKTPLLEMKAKLGLLTFERRLGSMADRAGRIAHLADRLAAAAGLGEADRRTVQRAGELAKFDLGSQMVTELSGLAGTMAREYALRAGETVEVADALIETEQPRSAGDALPASAAGAVLALADRFDLLAGLFAIGSAPTGSSDPYGLRRAALGVISILRARPELARITLGGGLAAAAELQPVSVPREALDEAHQFAVRRLEQALLEDGSHGGNTVEAVRAVLPLADAPARAEATLTELERLTGDAEFAQLAAALQRVRRIVPAGTEPLYDTALFEGPAEHALHNAFVELRSRLGEDRGLARFAAEGRYLVGPVNTFFDQVMVMAENPAVRANRLGLLAAIDGLAAQVLAWAELS